MISQYRFMRTKGGKTYFARVWVDVVQPCGDTIKVGHALRANVNRDAGEANASTEPEWVDAALEEMRETLQHAKVLQLLVSARATLNKIVGSPVDTRPDVVGCAAGLAVWKALGFPSPAPEAEFGNNQWRLHFSSELGPLPIEANGAPRKR